jgi:hypothetical protein
MGEFMKNKVEIFTPWSWKAGMWETLHLFSRYNKGTSIKGESSNESLVSAYPSINANQDSMTVVLVNRSVSLSQSTTLTFDNFVLSGSEAKVLTLKSLPTTETFVSHTQNALAESKSLILGNSTNITLPPMSVTSVQLLGKVGQVPIVLGASPMSEPEVRLYPNPSTEAMVIEWTTSDFESLEIVDANGRLLSEQKITPLSHQITINQMLTSGTYVVRLVGKDKIVSKKIVVY